VRVARHLVLLKHLQCPHATAALMKLATLRARYWMQSVGSPALQPFGLNLADPTFPVPATL
jgi:hypothetical protein